MNCNRTFALSLLCILTFASNTAQPKPVIVFDIHGVLLKEDIESLVKKQIAKLQGPHRSIKKNPFFVQLCSLMQIYRPLGQPTTQYHKEYGIPYEVFALFSGIKSPTEVYQALISMLNNASLEEPTLLILTALVNTIFRNAERVSALTPIPSGIALFHACLASTVPVYLYTNAPTEWITQYKQLFPEIFTPISDEHMLCSGNTGLVKPSPAVLALIAEKAQCEIKDLLLIDDSEINCNAATAAGASATLFTAATPKRSLEMAELHADTEE